MRLLLVEDHQRLATLMRKGLKTAGFDADIVGTADEASAALGAAQYDAMVLDLGLPDRDGIDLLRTENASRTRVESLIAQGVRFDVCVNTLDTIKRETGKRPAIIPSATPVQVGVGQILSLTENGYTLVRP